MKKDISYLINLLDHWVNGAWVDELRNVLQSPELKTSQIQIQHCTAYFALNQAIRRLESSRRIKKMTFGVESLISQLNKLPEEDVLDYYAISTSQYLGVCYVFLNQLIGCEFIQKTGVETKPGLWLDGKKIF
jgi:ABC-type uncharacterized transport system permease subunit